MTGLEWFLILLLVVAGGFYLLSRRFPAPIRDRPTHPDRATEPGGLAQDAHQHANDATNMQRSHHHGGCC